MLHALLIILPPWAYAVVVTWLGHWGETHVFPRRGGEHQEITDARFDWSAVLIINLILLSLIPSAMLSRVGWMLPFQGAHAGLAVGIGAYLFGCVPIRLLERHQHGWDLTAWRLLIDLVRVGGAFLLVGWLVVP
jgi:hypothetical protein